MGLTFRQKLLSVLAAVYGINQKEIGARLRKSAKDVSQLLRRPRRGEIKDDLFESLLAAMACTPATVPIVTACLESLEALEEEGDLTEDERVEIELEVLAVSRLTREALAEAVRLSRAVPSEGYPEPHDVEPARRRAAELLARLKALPEPVRPVVVRVVEECQTWSVCEQACHASEREASRNLEAAAAWARLAVKIARRVRGPKPWRRRLKAYAAAFAANGVRVRGDLRAAEAAFARAKRLWQAGSDPDGVLDPGRMLDLEASLRRAQRRFDEALALLDEAATVGRSPACALIKKGFTLEVMGEPERAVEALRQAEPLVERETDPHLWNLRRLNLAASLCNLGRYGEALEVVEEARPLATELGDEIDSVRITWLEGRIAAGLGRPWEARALLAEARQAFEARGMVYDVALALLEEAVLLLEEGRRSELKALARRLARVFAANGVHREALAALQLFYAAAERGEATPDLASRVLRFLFRARHDQDLRFEL